MILDLLLCKFAVRFELRSTEARPYVYIKALLVKHFRCSNEYIYTITGRSAERHVTAQYGVYELYQATGQEKFINLGPVTRE